jgi:glycosyltransferase involved in cell wall biosynthesis
VGNIGNNAYQNARMLNDAGIDSDVLCYDYYHLMGCPEWEDAEVGPLPEGLDHDFPDWSRVSVGGFRRPHWFAQGPLLLAMLYLRSRGTASSAGERALWRLLEASRWALARRRLRGAFRLCYLIAVGGGRFVAGLMAGSRPPGRRAAGPGGGHGGAVPAWAEPFLRRFATLFPERPDALRMEDLGHYAAGARILAPLFARYDVVIGYATDAILPMLAGHPRYMAFEHGTLRSIPFEDSAAGRLTALAYRTAACAFVTNCDNVRAVERLGLDNARYVPHPVNDRLVAAADGSALRRELQDAHGADFVVFHPSRHHWEPARHPSWEKGNDVLLRGFGRFVREVAPRALLVLVRWGRTVADSEALLRAEGAEHRTLWIDPVPNRTMLRYIHASDVVADQFWLGTFGGITPKAMACGRPVLLRLDPAVHAWCFPELPPHIESRSPGDVFEGLRRSYQEPVFRAELGAASRAWYRRYHAEDAVLGTLMDALSPGPGSGEISR